MNLPRNTTNWVITGTETYRLSSRALWANKKAGISGYGTNLQNVNKNERILYWADDNKTLVQVDQSGAEALIIAYLAEKGKFRELFLQEIKPHVYIGLAFPQHWPQYPYINEIARLPIQEVRTHPGFKALENAIKESDNNPPATRYYYHYKQTCHSSNLGIKAPALQLNMLEKSGGKVALTCKQSENYLAAYHGMFPEIRKWNLQVEEQYKKTKILYNLQGYPRIFTTDLDEYNMKEAYAYIPQSTVGTITNIAFTQLQTFIEEHDLNWDLLGNCHDSYLAQCDDSEVNAMAKQMHTFMCQNLVSPTSEKFSMKAEIQIGRNWAPYKEGKNEEGLKEYII